jgi:nucleoside-diphosphate-sugar epimerase
MKALVTGGAGFLGRYITEQLVARGDTVRVFSRGDYPELERLGVECVRGDIRDTASVRAACQGIDAVFHTAALPGIWGSWREFHSVNTLGTFNVIDGCVAEEVPKLIYTSSPSVVYDGQPHTGANETLPYPQHYMTHYPQSKALGEQAVLRLNGARGIATVALRPHLIWGPRDNHLIPRLVQRAKSGRLRRVGAGDNLISMSYVENAAAAHLQAADRLAPGSPVAGQAYFINEPEPVSLWKWVDDLLALAGLPPLKKRISAGAAYTAGAILESAYWLLRLPGEPPMTRFLASQLSSSHWYDVSKAQRDFGYRPIVSVAEGMRRLEPELRRLAQG